MSAPDPINMPCLQDEKEAQASGDFEGLKAENDALSVDPPDNQLADRTHGDSIQSHVQCPNCGYFVKLPGIP